MDSLVGTRQRYEWVHKRLKRDFAALTNTPSGLSSLATHPSAPAGPAWRISGELGNGGRLDYHRLDQLLDEDWPEDADRGRVRVDNLWAGRHGAAAAVEGLDRAHKTTVDEYERAEDWCLCFGVIVEKLLRSLAAPRTDAQPALAGRAPVAPAVPQPVPAASSSSSASAAHPAQASTPANDLSGHFRPSPGSSRGHAPSPSPQKPDLVPLPTPAADDDGQLFRLPSRTPSVAPAQPAQSLPAARRVPAPDPRDVLEDLDLPNQDYGGGYMNEEAVGDDGKLELMAEDEAVVESAGDAAGQPSTGTVDKDDDEDSTEPEDEDEDEGESSYDPEDGGDSGLDEDLAVDENDLGAAHEAAPRNATPGPSRNRQAALIPPGSASPAPAPAALAPSYIPFDLSALTQCTPSAQVTRLLPTYYVRQAPTSLKVKNWGQYKKPFTISHNDIGGGNSPVLDKHLCLDGLINPLPPMSTPGLPIFVFFSDQAKHEVARRRGTISTFGKPKGAPGWLYLGERREIAGSVAFLRGGSAFTSLPLAQQNFWVKIIHSRFKKTPAKKVDKALHIARTSWQMKFSAADLKSEAAVRSALEDQDAVKIEYSFFECVGFDEEKLAAWQAQVRLREGYARMLKGELLPSQDFLEAVRLANGA
ncbi:hypothetical protein JCM8097_001799 [Rhodosporidiobolus ruineniae]